MTDEPLSWIEVEINPLDERNFDPDEQPPPPPDQGKTADEIAQNLARRGIDMVEKAAIRDKHGRPLAIVRTRRRPKDK